MRVLVALVATAFLTVGVSAFDYVMTFENPSNKEIDLYYIASPIEEHLMGTVTPGGDLSHTVVAGQNFVMRSRADTFRTMIQIDDKDPDGAHEFKISFINLMGESASTLDIHYDDKVVGSAKINEPTTQGAFIHNRLTIKYMGNERLAVRAIPLKDEL
mmetsp:Transcript_18996/g.49876  ORF Transcript_18996/g.49876 Transcript_18996/m.49876 type:complete len:158 (+) Transcript_18996:64-537(+)|eukprot:CAMPEP_0119473372 /NCGR_PEP_ID=MMETSP1344-20130328/5060_1 /TAXON_ID=236787 /ORGANISM="Florenciella parvula, Strain CCMP2471" /LENGTH=157 /DNA_ID=CAMNT_0007506479 /DNA_START=72 /DNA_END=545 /DNA_ORIENTATION=+